MNKPFVFLILPLLIWALGADAQVPDGSGGIAGLQRISLSVQNNTKPRAELPMETLENALVAALEERGYSVVPSDTDGAANCMASVTAFEEKSTGEKGADRELSMRMKMDVSRPGSLLSGSSSCDTMKCFPAERVEADRAACLETFFRQAAETSAKNLSLFFPSELRISSPSGDGFTVYSLSGADDAGPGEIFESMLEEMRKDAHFLSHYKAREREKGRLPHIVFGGLEGYPYGDLLSEGGLRIFDWLPKSGLFEVENDRKDLDRARRLLDEGTPAERAGDDMPDYLLEGDFQPVGVGEGREMWRFSLTLRDFVSGQTVWQEVYFRSQLRGWPIDGNRWQSSSFECNRGW